MNDIAAIVARLKQRAQASPWADGVPAPGHYHRFHDGLSICFTLDIIPGGPYWHLSVARTPEGPTREEIDFWRRAFFDEKPTIEVSALLLGVAARHFHWKVT